MQGNAKITVLKWIVWILRHIFWLGRQSEPDEDDNDDESSDDIETHAMIFRALREHGYDVTPGTKWKGEAVLSFKAFPRLVKTPHSSGLNVNSELIYCEHVARLTDTFLLEGISNGQVGQLGARGMLQLYRASEMIFPGELLLDYTKNITTTFLKSTLASSSDAALKKEVTLCLPFSGSCFCQLGMLIYSGSPLTLSFQCFQICSSC